MEIIILEDYAALSKKAAQIVAQRIQAKPNLVLGLATGSTPLGMYRELVQAFGKKAVDFTDVVTFNLDEYYPIAKDNPQSYYQYMLTNFWSQVNLKSENRHIPEGFPRDVMTACTKYEQAIQDAGGIDLQVVGIGENGHIGFNEPGASLFAFTHLVNLTDETIRANSRFFQDISEVPQKAITMGMGTIMKAQEVLLLAAGENKAEAIKNTLTGNISTQVPASMLQAHPKITVLLDQGAGKYMKSNQQNLI